MGLYSLLVGRAESLGHIPVTSDLRRKQHSPGGSGGLQAEVAHEFLHQTAGFCR